MFSTRIRQASAWSAVVPLLASPSGLNLRGKIYPSLLLVFPARLKRSLALLSLFFYYHSKFSQNEETVSLTYRSEDTDQVRLATECKLEVHDLAIDIPTKLPPKSNQSNGSRAQKRTLRVALLEPRDMAHETQNSTLQNLQRLSHMTGGVDIAIIMLLQDAVQSAQAGRITAEQPAEDQSITPTSMMAYLQLQSLISSDPHLSSIPILPLHSTTALCSLLQTHVQGISVGLTPAASATIQAAQTQPLDLVAYCTSAAPIEVLDQHTVYLLTDLLGSVKELAEASLTSEGRGKVEERLDGEVSEEVVESLWQFWRSEWAIE